MRAQRIGRVLRKHVEDKQMLKDAKFAVGMIQETLGKKGEHWIQDNMRRDGGYCLLGAIDNVWVDAEVRDIAFTAIKAAIPGFSVKEVDVFEEDDNVAIWNDKADREFKSIKQVLKRAKKAIGFAISGEKR